MEYNEDFRRIHYFQYSDVNLFFLDPSQLVRLASLACRAGQICQGVPWQ